MKREAEGRMLLPAKVTPHTLRRTWAMLALTAGRDARWVMAQMGHQDARLTLQVYAQVIQRQRIDIDLVWELMRFADDRMPGRAPDEGCLTQRMAQCATQAPLVESTSQCGDPRSPCKGGGWARRVSNLRPLACEASALPLSYAPEQDGSLEVALQASAIFPRPWSRNRGSTRAR